MEAGKAGHLWLVWAGLILIAAISLIYYTSTSHVTGKLSPQNNYSFPCALGYICGMKSNGCAVPGAIYNCPAIIINNTGGNGGGNNQNGTVAVNLSEELNNSAMAGFNLTEIMFYANSSQECLKELISACDNNVPSQFICINQAYSGTVSSQYSQIYQNPHACPLFILAGNVSCGISGNYCVVLGQGP